jgi:hypothetical protein
MKSFRSSRLLQAVALPVDHPERHKLAPELLQAPVERLSVPPDRDVATCRRVQHHDPVAMPVAGVHQVNPPVGVVQVDELRLDPLLVRLPHVRIGPVALHQQHGGAALEQVVEHRHGHHRLADAALASAHPVDAPRPVRVLHR